MAVLRSLVLALSTFTRLPMPRIGWEPENMRFMMAWLPFVGLVVGAFVALWCGIADAAGFNPVLKAAGVALVPVAVTGGYHLDGFADVVDAQSSHAEPERKRQIMKDPHIGAFAAIAVAAYLVAYAGLATELAEGWQPVVLLVCLHVMSRCGAGFASTVFWGNGEQGTLTAFKGSADMRVTLAALAGSFVVAFVAAASMSVACAAVMAVCEAALLAWLNWFAGRNFGGMSGDVAGFFLQVCELALIACLVVTAKAVGL